MKHLSIEKKYIDWSQALAQILTYYNFNLKYLDVKYNEYFLFVVKMLNIFITKTK